MSKATRDDEHAARAASRYEVRPLEIDGLLHALNDRGESVGHWTTADGEMHAILVTPRGVIDLGTLGGSASSARGINEAGAIVGGALTAGDVAYHAFLYEAGVMHDLNALIAPDAGSELLQALGINNAGDIVAIGHRSDVDSVVLLKRCEHASRDAGPTEP
jgi:probable HAF family extracellular repeat protein